MKKTGAMLLAAALALALAAPAAAEAPRADGWTGVTWSAVVDWLSGWAEGLRQALAGSTEGMDDSEGGEEDPTAVPTAEPVPLLDGEECGTQTEAWPKIDPNG